MAKEETTTFTCDRCGDTATVLQDDDQEGPDGWSEIPEAYLYGEDDNIEGDTYCKPCTDEWLKWRKEDPGRQLELHG
jgi:hypothetical protein